VTDVSDHEFEELPMREPAWMVLCRTTAYRKQLLAAGYSPLPVNGKAPPISGWQDIQATEDVINDWEDNYANATNTGILTRTTPAIDIDVLDPGVADKLQQIAKQMIGVSPVRIGQAPKRALLYRTDLPFDKLATPIYISSDGHAHKVEVLCSGQQIVVKGIHPVTQSPYSYLGSEPGPELKREALQLLTAEKAREFIIAAERCMSAHGWTPKKKTNGAASPTCNGQWIASERERAYAQAALDGCADELAHAIPGARNDTLNKKAFRLGTMVARGWLSTEDVFDALFAAADACGLNSDDGAGLTGKTIQSGLDSGRKSPHPDLPSGSGEVPSEPPPWPRIDEAAYSGLVGDIVQTFLPHTEADPVALLIQTLAAAGNVIGRLPHYRVEADQHRVNLFTVLVGDSAKGRKGVSFGRVRSVVKTADETWASDRIKGGLSSGEGFIHEVRDPLEKYNSKEQCTEIVDPGAADKRLMVVESEFASAISVAERPGNTLSPLIRRAWDGDKLSTLTRNSPLTATGAHISIIGHITVDELRARINRTDLANGFANRFLFVLSRRSKVLPFGGSLNDSEILHLGEKLTAAIERAKFVGRVSMTDNAQSKWAAVYPALSAAKPGLLGAIIARAEAQTIRLALIYALLDGSDQIDLRHLEAALAVWEYCELSAVHIFGRAIGDPVADEIERALQHVGAAGMSRTAIRDMFSRNRSGDRIGAALHLLMTMGRARFETGTTGGRPTETWFARKA
jgi:hypothetical protein